MALEAVVLAAGRGTRMRPLTNVVPKALLPYRDKPLLHVVLDEMFAAGTARARVLIGAGPSQLIRSHLQSVGDLTPLDWSTADVETVEVCLTETPEPVQALSRHLPPTTGTVVAAHCDEVVPAMVTRLAARAATSTGKPVVAVVNRQLAVPRLVRLSSVRPFTHAPGLRLPADHRMVGRMAFPADLARQVSRGEITAGTLADLVAELLRIGRQVLAVEWPGPYADVGELWRYRDLWVASSPDRG